MTRTGPLALAMLLGIAGAARADGVYYAESFGFADTHGDIHRELADAFHVRLGIGMRIGPIAIEPWLAADKNLSDSDGSSMATIERSDGPTGRVDLGSWGLDLKYFTPITKRLPKLELYLRGGANVMQPSGALEGYSGRGFGFGAGIQLKGQVRALGFLWTPLFFLKYGPKVTGAIYIDDGIDVYRLHHDGDPEITAELVHLNVGFAVGSDF